MGEVCTCEQDARRELPAAGETCGVDGDPAGKACGLDEEPPTRNAPLFGDPQDFMALNADIIFSSSSSYSSSGNRKLWNSLKDTWPLMSASKVRNSLTICGIVKP